MVPLPSGHHPIEQHRANGENVAIGGPDGAQGKRLKPDDAKAVVATSRGLDAADRAAFIAKTHEDIKGPDQTTRTAPLGSGLCVYCVLCGEHPSSDGAFWRGKQC